MGNVGTDRPGTAVHEGPAAFQEGAAAHRQVVHDDHVAVLRPAFPHFEHVAMSGISSSGVTTGAAAGGDAATSAPRWTTWWAASAAAVGNAQGHAAHVGISASPSICCAR